MLHVLFSGGVVLLYLLVATLRCCRAALGSGWKQYRKRLPAGQEEWRTHSLFTPWSPLERPEGRDVIRVNNYNHSGSLPYTGHAFRFQLLWLPNSLNPWWLLCGWPMSFGGYKGRVYAFNWISTEKESIGTWNCSGITKTALPHSLSVATTTKNRTKSARCTHLFRILPSATVDHTRSSLNIKTMSPL